MKLLFKQRPSNENKLDSDPANRTFRFNYVCGLIDFTSLDINALHSAAPVVVPMVDRIVDAVFDKLLSIEATMTKLGDDSELPQRMKMFKLYLLKLFTAEYDEEFINYLDKVGKMHFKGGKHGVSIDYVYISGTFGFLSSQLNTAILRAGMDKEKEIATIVAVNKLLWIQNDFFSKYYLAAGGDSLTSLSGLAGAFGSLITKHSRRHSAPPSESAGLIQTWSSVVSSKTSKNSTPSPTSTESILSGTPARKNSDEYVPTISEIKRMRMSRFPTFERTELKSLVGLKDVPTRDRPRLFITKLRQCCVVYDFSDPFSDLKSKNIKSNTLQEIAEYLSTRKGVLTDAVYPVVAQMVRVYRLIYLDLSQPIPHY
jgi:hypothetical protein